MEETMSGELIDGLTDSVCVHCDVTDCCIVVCTQLCYVVRMRFGSCWKRTSASRHMTNKQCTQTEPNTQNWKQLLRQNLATVYGKAS